MELINTTNSLLAWTGIVSFIFAVYLVVDCRTTRYLADYVKRFGLWALFVVSGGATVVTFIYSDVFGFVPCGLCWLQRVFLFSQVVVYAVALYYQDFRVARYGIALSIFGLVISLYQHYLQMGGSALVGCPVAGEGADCTKRYLFEFGFMTYPLLAGISFILLIALGYYLLKVQSDNKAD